MLRSEQRERLEAWAARDLTDLDWSALGRIEMAQEAFETDFWKHANLRKV